MSASCATSSYPIPSSRYQISSASLPPTAPRDTPVPDCRLRHWSRQGLTHLGHFWHFSCHLACRLSCSLYLPLPLRYYSIVPSYCIPGCGVWRLYRRLHRQLATDFHLPTVNVPHWGHFKWGSAGRQTDRKKLARNGRAFQAWRTSSTFHELLLCHSLGIACVARLSGAHQEQVSFLPWNAPPRSLQQDTTYQGKVGRRPHDETSPFLCRFSADHYAVVCSPMMIAIFLRRYLRAIYAIQMLSVLDHDHRYPPLYHFHCPKPYDCGKPRFYLELGFGALDVLIPSKGD